MQGFLAWAITSREDAEAWIEGRSDSSSEDSMEGDCIVINAWTATSQKVNRVLIEHARKLGAGKEMVYFKRSYNNGTRRPRACASMILSRGTSNAWARVPNQPRSPLHHDPACRCSPAGRRLRALAVTAAARLDELPDIPTVGEFVLGYKASQWFGSRGNAGNG